MALDWSSAEGYTRGLAHDETSRMSAIPLDVVNSIAPYLHTYTYDGLSYRDGVQHGTHVSTGPDYVGVYEMRDGELLGAAKWWRTDGSMSAYSEYDTESLVFRICWGDRIRIYDGGWNYHDTLPAKYRWVWEVMTQTI